MQVSSRVWKGSQKAFLHDCKFHEAPSELYKERQSEHSCESILKVYQPPKNPDSDCFLFQVLLYGATTSTRQIHNYDFIIFHDYSYDFNINGRIQ